MIYIANGTAQRYIIALRVPESNGPIYPVIGPGQQIQIGADFGQQQTDAIVRHLDLFGARRLRENEVLGQKFSGLVYSTTKPVRKDDILESNDNVQTNAHERSIDELKKTVSATDARVRVPGKRRRGGNTELHITAMASPGERPSVPVDMTIETDTSDK